MFKSSLTDFKITTEKTQFKVVKETNGGNKMASVARVTPVQVRKIQKSINAGKLHKKSE